MKNQEAISVLELINARTDYFLINDYARAKAIDMAISALQAQDVPDTNAGGTVSRQAAIDALIDEFKRVPTTAIRAKNRIDRLPSAQPNLQPTCNQLATVAKDKNVPCKDTISRQDAIDAIVNTVSEIGLHDNSEVARYGATFRQHEIIDIIEGMPSTQLDVPEINDGDMISRQAAIDALDEIESEVADGDGFQYEKWRRYFCELPSTQPDRCDTCRFVYYPKEGEENNGNS